MGARGGLRCLCLAAAWLQRWAALGQVIKFEAFPAPPPGSLSTAYVFFVYSLDEAPVKSEGTPYLSLEGLSATVGPDELWSSDVQPNGYGGVQVTVMRHMDVNKILDLKAGRVCSTQSDVARDRSADTNMLILERAGLDDNSTGQVFQQSVPFTGKTAPSMHWAIERTGIYMLVLSNCGSIKSAVVNGTVTVKHAYGYLPGNEYPKMTFFGWLILAYAGLAIVWIVLSVRWWDQLFKIQKCILGVLLLGFGESLVWSVFLHKWNIEGQPTTGSTVIFVMALLFTVLKSTFSYMLVLSACLGWGVTKPNLGGRTLCKLIFLCVLHVGFAFAREVVLSFRHSHSIPAELVLTVFAPVTLLNTLIFCWTFCAISRLMEKLKESNQTEKFQLFLTLFAVLIAAIGVATLSLLVEVYNLSRPPQAVWKHQWILTDAVSHLLYLLVLVAMMWLWRPHSESQRYAFSEQLAMDDMDGDAGATSPGRAKGETIGHAHNEDSGKSAPPDAFAIEDDEQAPQGRPADQEQQRDEV
jgi:hypothetical protein